MDLAGPADGHACGQTGACEQGVEAGIAENWRGCALRQSGDIQRMVGMGMGDGDGHRLCG